MRRHRQLVTLFVTASMTAAALLAGAPAHADSDVSADARRDVLWTSRDGSERQIVPSAALGDIVQVRTQHTTQAVRVWVTYRALVTGDQYLYAAVGTRQIYGAAVLFHVSKRHPHQKPRLLYLGSAEDWTCPRASWDLSYARNQLYVRVPRQCLANPDRVHVAAAWFRQGRAGRKSDFAFLDGTTPDVAAFGPWVASG